MYYNKTIASIELQLIELEAFEHQAWDVDLEPGSGPSTAH
jgi:hypothetical protein